MFGRKKTRTSSARTVKKYRKYLEQLGVFLNGEYLDATLSKLENFSGGWMHRKGYAAASRKVAVAASRGFYRWLSKRRLISSNPSDDLVYPKIGRRLPRFMGLDSAEALLMQPDLDSLSGICDSAILALMMGCGFRVSGMCGLNESQLIWYKYDNADRLAIRVLEKGNKERLVPVPSEAMLLLQAYLGHKELDYIDSLLMNGDQVLFINLRNRHVPEWEHRGENRRMSPRAIDRMIKRYALIAGLPEEHAHAHAICHLFGTELTESDTATLQIQALMGMQTLKPPRYTPT
ncbi:tyrosine-type recombinase/integrase [Candidatus Enterovibrio escicola]|uniref:Site-specific recombinase XerD n=1 Tax=Candidatus Enterovibrio escicola TaxID=1927127 RepID=A0A2A5T381_9GAMM|nr:tyrosine-type recombinase/integrase [Candidatus Enterovibrio escacola]PCS22604.1 Site-specific recombinase XerD [Candidatus Enterovibrio escacola]